ncbi:hypothetical protein RSAG8_12126, partial [Rhizoctonia solani AG-8 WAC10335]
MDSEKKPWRFYQTTVGLKDVTSNDKRRFDTPEELRQLPEARVNMH